MDPASIVGAIVPSLISSGIDAAFGGGTQAPSPQIAAPQVQQRSGLNALTNIEAVGGKPFGFGGTMPSNQMQGGQGMFLPSSMPSPQATYTRGLASSLGSSLVSALKNQLSESLGGALEGMTGGRKPSQGGSSCFGGTCDLDSEEKKRKKQEEFLSMLEKMNWG